MRRYLESHPEALAETLVREDVEWGLHGNEVPPKWVQTLADATFAGTFDSELSAIRSTDRR